MPWNKEEQTQMVASEQQANDTVFASNLPQEFDDAMLQESFGGYGTIAWCKLMPGNPGGRKIMAALVQYSSVEEAQFIVENPHVLGIEPAPRLSYHVKKPKSGKGAAKGGGGAAAAAPYVRPGGFAGGKGGNPGAAAYAANGGGQQNFGGVQQNFGGGSSMSSVKKGLKGGHLLPASQWSSADEGAVFVGGLPAGATDLDLYEIFAPFGAIPPRGVKVIPASGKSAGCIGFVDFIDPACAQAATATLDGFTAQDGTALQVRLKTPGKKRRKGE